MKEQYDKDDSKQIMEKIFYNLDIEYLKTLKNKEYERPEELLNNFMKFSDNFTEVSKDSNILIYPYKYDILSEKVFDQMNKSPESILKDSKPREYLINDGNFIIKIESDSPKRYELLIAIYNRENDKLIPELLFKYESKDLMKYHFEKLKQTSFKNFSDNNSTSNGKYLISKEKNGTSSQIIGKIFLLKDNNYKETSYNKLVNISENNLKVRL